MASIAPDSTTEAPAVPPRTPDAFLLAALLIPVLGAAWCGWPNPLVEDPYPLAAGAAWMAIFALVGGLAFARDNRRVRPILGALLALPLVSIAGELVSSGSLDTFALRRAGVLELAGIVALALGTVLVSSERNVLARACIVSSIFATGGALIQAWSQGDLALLAGSAGNTGLLSQLALPGAVIGALVATRSALTDETSVTRNLGLLSVALFALHTGLAPVLAGALAFALALLPSCFAGRGSVRVLLLCGALPLILLVGSRTIPSAQPDVQAPIENAQGPGPAGDFGGAEVRWRIWTSLPAMVAEEPWTGVGAGQFQASFPPHRDARETMISRAGICSEATTEVNHAHNDALHLIAEHGLLFGTGAAALLLFALWTAARRSAAKGDGSAACADPALAAGALAVLVNGLFHAPLSANAPASWLGLILIGTLFGGSKSSAPAWTRWLPLALALPAMLFGLPLLQHGRALSDYVGHVKAMSTSPAASEEASDLELVHAALLRALEAAPDSTDAQALMARLTGNAERWSVVLEQHPHSVEALEALATSEARRGEIEGAHQLFTRALGLSADSPRVLRNLTRSALDLGRPTEAREHVLTLTANGCLDREWLLGLGYERLLIGEREAGALLLALADERFEAPVPETIHQLALAARESDATLRYRALTTWAKGLWGDEHAAAQNFDLAVRSYRKALTPTKPYVPGGAPSARLALAAALVRAGQEGEARATLEGLDANARGQVPLDDWMRAALREAGLLDD